MLNSINFTHDPDMDKDTQDKSDITFRWLCRRDCETFPEYDMTDWDNWVVTKEGTLCDAEEYPEEFFDFGCFIGDGYNNTGKSRVQQSTILYVDITLLIFPLFAS